MKIITGTLATLLLAGTAMAQPHITVEGILGFNAEGEYDSIKVSGNKVAGDSDEDIEKNFGVQGTFDVPMNGKLRVGGRVAYITGEGDDTEDDYSTITGDLWLRFPFIENPVTAFVAGGGGVTRIAIDGDNDADGIGYHIIIGAGVQFAVSPGIDLVAGLYYDRHAANLEGKANGTKFEVEDGVLSRMLLTAGLAF